MPSSLHLRFALRVAKDSHLIVIVWLVRGNSTNTINRAIAQSAYLTVQWPRELNRVAL